MPTSHVRSYELAFSLDTQTDIFTALTDGQINKKRATRNYSPIKEVHPAKVSDRAWFGKGHPFPTFLDRIERMYQYGATERSASDLEAEYTLALVMGNNASGVFTWQSVATNKFVRYTSLIEKQGSEYEKKLSGAWVSKVTLKGERNNHVTISYDGGGRKYEDSTATMPDLSAATFFKTLFGTVSFGLSGGESDISAEVLSWQVTLNQNPIPMFLLGQPAGEEDLVGETLIGDQTTEADVVIKVNTLHRNRFLNQSTCGLTIVAKSGDGLKTLSLAMPNVILAEEAFGEESTTVTYTLKVTDEGVLKAGTAEPITITLT
jgi:hypothetical protein